MNGWWKFHRRMLDHPVFQLPGDQFKVWCVCCSLANHDPGEWWDGSQRVILETGQFVTSQEHLAEKAKTSRQTIRTALKNLLKIESISTKTVTKRYTLITVVKWDTYSGDSTQPNQDVNQELTKSQPRANQELTIAGEGRELKKKTLGDFDTFWAAYPRKRGKDQAKKAWATLHPENVLFEAILTSLEQHKKTLDWLKDGGQFIPFPATWLRGRRWEDELQLKTSTEAPDYDPASDPESDWPVSWECRTCGEIHDGKANQRGTCLNPGAGGPIFHVNPKQVLRDV